MAKLTRVFQNIFGVNAGPSEIAEFGSLAAGSPVLSNDPVVIQSLSNFTDGWFAAILGGNSPAIEDMNALFFLIYRQMAYIFQAGIPEWNTSTIYFIGSLVTEVGTGRIYKSLTDNNTGNALSSSANWALLAGAIKSKTANYSLLPTDGFIFANSDAGEFTLTLPSAVTYPGLSFKLKKTGSTQTPVDIVSSAGLIDGETQQQMVAPFTALEIISDGTDWYVF